MDRVFKQRMKRVLPMRVVTGLVKYRTLLSVVGDFGGKYRRECPICSHKGYFFGYGSPLRYDAVCPSCGSRERHRLHHLAVSRHPEWIDGARVLHFTAEACLKADYRRRASRYVCADIDPGPDEVRVDATRMDFPDASVDTIICHHVMEHVADDHAALSEMRRVLRPGGVALLSVPICENWERTYSDASVDAPKDRDLHFGQVDHLRYYGRDFRDMIRAAGFDLSEHVATEPDVSRYGLVRGEAIFIATKPH